MSLLDESSGLDSVLDTSLAALRTPAAEPAAADEAPARKSVGEVGARLIFLTMASGAVMLFGSHRREIDRTG